MVVRFEDNFAGSSANLNGRTPDTTGTSWALTFTAGTGQIAVTGGVAQASVAGDTATRYFEVTPAFANQNSEVEVEFAAVASGAGNDDVFGLVLAGDGIGEVSYSLESYDIANARVCKLYDAGSSLDVLATWVGTAIKGPGVKWKFERRWNGTTNTLKGYYDNGSGWIAMDAAGVTDTLVTTPGRAGMYWGNGMSNGDPWDIATAWQITRFVARDGLSVVATRTATLGAVSQVGRTSTLGFEAVGLGGRTATVSFAALGISPQSAIATLDAVAEPSTSQLYGAQDFKIWLRRTSGVGTPTVDIELWENGVFKATLLNDVSITSTTGQLLTAAWDASQITDLSGIGVECRVASTPTATNTVEIGAIEWNAQYLAVPAAPVLEIAAGFDAAGFRAALLATSSLEAIAQRQSLLSTASLDAAAQIQLSATALFGAAARDDFLIAFSLEAAARKALTSTAQLDGTASVRRTIAALFDASTGVPFLTQTAFRFYQDDGAHL
jgi:hypothetical protein